MQSKVLVYVVLIIGVGIAYNYFTKSDDNISEQSEQFQEESETVIYKAAFQDFRSPKFREKIESQPIKQIPLKVEIDEYEVADENVAIRNIMYCKYEKNKVYVYTYDDNNPKIVTSSLTAVNDLIGEQDFMYEFKKHTINLDYVTRIVTSNKPNPSMKHRIEITPMHKIKLDKNRKAEFVRELNEYRKYAEPVN